MRTQAEILARIKERAPKDMFGFEWEEYVSALTRDSVESLRGTLMKADADLKAWEPSFKTDDDIRKQCLEYMDFAWEKANNCRGISAGRSLAHYKAWLWLLGQDGFEDIDQYEFYGKDNLVRICKFFDLDASKWDDGRRVNTDS
jgi:hypothetical protein